MPTLIGRWLTATKNADGSVMLEFAMGNFPTGINRSVMTLSSAEATALGSVISGVTGATTTAKHSSEPTTPGNWDH